MGLIINLGNNMADLTSAVEFFQPFEPSQYPLTRLEPWWQNQAPVHHWARGGLSLQQTRHVLRGVRLRRGARAEL